jgi:hypothetical protein
MEPAKFRLCSVLLTFQRINVLVTNDLAICPALHGLKVFRRSKSKASNERGCFTHCQSED